MKTIYAADEIIILNKLYRVTGKAFNYYRDITELAIRNSEPGKKYQLKQMFGPEIWEPFSNWERRVIGMCVARMVRNHVLPLRPVIKKSRYPLQYWVD